MKPNGQQWIVIKAIDIIPIMLGESYAKQLRKISLAGNKVGRRMNYISGNICDQLVSRLRSSKFGVK